MNCMSLEDAALRAARAVVVLEFFGWRISWAAVVRACCGLYFPAVSPESSDRRCAAYAVIWTILHELPVPEDAVEALLSQDEACGAYGGEHMDSPDIAAVRLVKAVIEPREDLVRMIADALLSMDPVNRRELLMGWCGHATRDPIQELIRAANRDDPYVVPLSRGEICC